MSNAPPGSTGYSNLPLASFPQPRRILVRGVNWLGDAVMTTPALQRLRERFPTANITLLTQEKLAELWRHQPSIDAAMPFGSAEGAWSVARRLRGPKFDLALVLPNSPRSALEMWLARIPHRVGYACSWRNWLLTERVPGRPGHSLMRKRSLREISRLNRAGSSTPGYPPANAPLRSHQIHDYLHLAAALGANSEAVPPLLAVSPEETEAVAAKFGLGSVTATASPLFGLNPGAEYGPAKRWPLERFIAAAREVQERTYCSWLLLGGKSDVPAAQAIESALRTENSPLHNLAGQTSLRELMAALKLCRVLLTNDTGPMHVAAALGTPVVVPFGSTSPELTGPGLPGDSRHRLLAANVPCAPCFRRTCPIDFRCMTGISVESVVQAVLQAAAGR